MEIRNEEVINDPLDELIVDDMKSLDINLLANILKEHLTLTKNGEVNYRDSFHDYKQWKRMMVYLLARKAISIKKLKDIKEKATYKEISDGALMPVDSIGRTSIDNLRGIVKKDEEGLYIPNYNLIRCKQILDGKQKIPTQIKKIR